MEVVLEGMGWSHLAQGRDHWGRFFVYYNKPSSCIKYGEFLDYLKVSLASQEGLCSSWLVE
jgi:hypothetical protein